VSGRKNRKREDRERKDRLRKGREDKKGLAPKGGLAAMGPPLKCGIYSYRLQYSQLYVLYR